MENWFGLKMEKYFPPLKKNWLQATVTRSLPPLLLTSALLVSGITLAQSSGTVADLNTLVTNRQYTEAYALALQLQEANEGNPDFDFLYGLAALETGHANEAVFAFE